MIQHFVLSFSISYWDLIKFPYFTDTTERGVRGWKEAQRRGEDWVTLWISLISRNKPANVGWVSLTHSIFRPFLKSKIRSCHFKWESTIWKSMRYHKASNTIPIQKLSSEPWIQFSYLYRFIQTQINIKMFTHCHIKVWVWSQAILVRSQLLTHASQSWTSRFKSLHVSMILILKPLG